MFQPALPRLLAGLAFARLTGRPATFRGGPLALCDVPEPRLPGGRWVRVQNVLGGICGTDLDLLRLAITSRSAVLADGRDRQRRAIFPGHEAVGRVVELGPGVRGVAVGERVVLMPGTHCASIEIDDPCAFCRAGDYALCVHRGDPRPDFCVGGGWSERFVRHESQLLRVPEQLPDGVCVLFEPASCALHAVLRRPPAPGDEVLVVGGGTVGLLVMAALRAIKVPARVTVLTKHGFQTERALELGADLAVDASRGDVYEQLATVLGTTVLGRRRRNRLLKGGFAIVYDCVGDASTFHDALRWCRPRGAVVLIGVDLFPGVLDRSPIWHREVEVVGIMGSGADGWEDQRSPAFRRVAEWVEQGRLRLAGLLTHCFVLSEYRRAFRTAAAKSASGAVKVAFDFRPPSPGLAGRGSESEA